MVKQKNWPQLLQRAKPQGLLGMEPATHSLVRLWKTYIFPIATQMEPGTNVKARTCEQKMWHNLEMLALTPVTLNHQTWLIIYLYEMEFVYPRCILREFCGFYQKGL